MVGTAGHIDHGKTTLIAALTGVDTDRLPEERERGITIELGYAPLTLPSGRRVSVVDVPGHERFVRTMVAGATGIDVFLMVVAADDGVMPQTVEHARVLRALGVERGVVAITKADLADPERARAQAAELLPGVPVVVGAEAVAAALDAVADGARGRAAGDVPVLHVDRVFTIRGAGTVVTGTLWSGTIARGDEVAILPAGTTARVRSVQVHDEPRDHAVAGQRVALGLPGAEVARGDVVTAPGALTPSYYLDADLDLTSTPRDVTVHHGTREVPAKLVPRDPGFQLRLDEPVLARAGDRVVVRSQSPPDTLGGGTIVDPHARRSRRPPGGEPAPAPAAAPAPPPLTPAALDLEERLRDAGPEALGEADLDPAALRALVDHGRAARLTRTTWLHPETLAHVRATATQIIEAEGQITLARLRDALRTSRRFAQAHLEHLDAEHVTLRRPDDSRVLRRRR